MTSCIFDKSVYVTIQRVTLGPIVHIGVISEYNAIQWKYDRYSQGGHPAAGLGPCVSIDHVSQTWVMKGAQGILSTRQTESDGGFVGLIGFKWVEVV